MINKQYLKNSNTEINKDEIIKKLNTNWYFYKNIWKSNNEELLKIIKSLWWELHNPENPIIKVKNDKTKNLKAMSNEDLEIHNECVYMENPPEYVLLYCVNWAENWWDFYIVNSEKIIKDLSERTMNILSNEEFLFKSQNWETERKVIFKHPTKKDNNIIFMSNIWIWNEKRNKIMTPKNKSTSTENAILEVRNKLENILHYAEFHNWKAWDLIIIDNYQVLHWREAFIWNDRELTHIRFNLNK